MPDIDLTGSAPARGYRTFVAIGDSFTEGLNDPGKDGRFRGWADRVAERLATLNPEFRYANLAIRGKLLDQIVRDQVPAALEMKPDLISFCGGANDLLRPGSDPDRVAKTLARTVRELRRTGAEVLMFTGWTCATPRSCGGCAASSPSSTCTSARSPTCTAAAWWTCGRCRACGTGGPGPRTGCT